MIENQIPNASLLLNVYVVVMPILLIIGSIIKIKNHYDDKKERPEMMRKFQESQNNTSVEGKQ